MNTWKETSKLIDHVANTVGEGGAQVLFYAAAAQTMKMTHDEACKLFGEARRNLIAKDAEMRPGVGGQQN